MTSDDVRLALRIACSDLNINLHRNTLKALAVKITKTLNSYEVKPALTNDTMTLDQDRKALPPGSYSHL